MSKRHKKQPSEPTELHIPFEIAVSLLRPDELEKLKQYIIMYKEKYGFEGEKAVQEQNSTSQTID